MQGIAVVEQLSAVGSIAGAILVVRGQRVMLDAELAQLYGVPTKRLNEQVRRNAARFPPDFMFQLNADERAGRMWSQNATTLRRTKGAAANRSQFATGSRTTRRNDQLPFAFTEHGCLMLANVLRSGRAVEVSVLIVRAFVRMRTGVAANVELASRVDQLAREVERQSGKLTTHDAAILKLLAEIRRLTPFPEPARRGIGFTAAWPKGK